MLTTVLWVAVMANSVNFIDGLDGLATGIVAIGAGAFFVYSHQLGVVGNIQASNAGPLIAIVAVGLAVGFLPHNFYPAKIFMGDGGAMLLGVLVAASTLSVVGQDPYEFSGRTYFFFAPILIPFFILGIPLLDTAFAVVRRAGSRHEPGGGRPQPSPSSAHEAGPRAPASCHHLVGVDRAAIRHRAVARRDELAQRDTPHSRGRCIDPALYPVRAAGAYGTCQHGQQRSRARPWECRSRECRSRECRWPKRQCWSQWNQVPGVSA